MINHVAFTFRDDLLSDKGEVPLSSAEDSALRKSLIIRWSISRVSRKLVILARRF